MVNVSCWQIKQEFDFKEIATQLGPGFSWISGEQSNQDLTVLDDDDWDIWRAGLLLLCDENNMLRLLRADDSCLAECPAVSDSRFWWQLPEGDLSGRLKTIIAVRAFMPKYECLLSRRAITILNEDEKIIVRAELFEISAKAAQPQRFIKILSLRGYEQEYARLIEVLSEFRPTPVADAGLRGLLQHSGLDVSISPNKPNFRLQDHEPAEAAVTRMAAELLQLARHQEQGILDDVDTEFVHQYRVNIRKTRSLISLFKKTLSAQRHQLLKIELKAIAGQTNQLRDFDVFILDHDYYRDLLPHHLWPGFDQLFRRIKRRRSAAYKKVVASLVSATYLERIGHLLLTLHQPPELATKQSRMGVKELVSAKILTQYRRIASAGRLINAGTPDDAVHALRIETKKLRYLMELFSELFPPDDMKRLIKHLKGLQDNLGRFNDFSVQQEFLFHCGRLKTLSAAQLASINGLAAVLYNKQLYERSLVVKNIATFLEQPVGNLFQKLFEPGPREGLKE